MRLQPLGHLSVTWGLPHPRHGAAYGRVDRRMQAGRARDAGTREAGTHETGARGFVEHRTAIMGPMPSIAWHLVASPASITPAAATPTAARPSCVERASIGRLMQAVVAIIPALL